MVYLGLRISDLYLGAATAFFYLEFKRTIIYYFVAESQAMSSAAKIERLYIWTESNDEHTQYLLSYNNKKRINIMGNRILSDLDFNDPPKRSNCRQFCIN